LQVIAEGVETSEDLAFLKARDCDEAQGFYFSPPLPPAEFVRLLKDFDSQSDPSLEDWTGHSLLN